jgi:hypothetical protein
MVNSWSQVKSYANSHPTRDGGSWSGWCQSFCWRSGGFSEANSFPSARLDCINARNRGHLIPASQIADQDVPVGWLALWDYQPDGHVAWVAENGRYLMASSSVTASLGRSMGYISMASYNNFSHGRPAGFSPYMGSQHLTGIALTSGGGGSTGGGTGGGTGGSTGGTIVLTADDKTWIQNTVTSSITNKIDDIVKGIWEHQMNSAVDGAPHLVQTYMAWAQRDAAAVKGAIDSASPARVLAKETSTPDIWALSPQQGTKRHVTAGQWTVLQACGIKFQTVADGSLAAFTTVT